MTRTDGFACVAVRLTGLRAAIAKLRGLRQVTSAIAPVTAAVTKVAESTDAEVHVASAQVAGVYVPFDSRGHRSSRGTAAQLLRGGSTSVALRKEVRFACPHPRCDSRLTLSYRMNSGLLFPARFGLAWRDTRESVALLIHAMLR